MRTSYIVGRNITRCVVGCKSIILHRFPYLRRIFKEKSVKLPCSDSVSIFTYGNIQLSLIDADSSVLFAVHVEYLGLCPRLGHPSHIFAAILAVGYLIFITMSPFGYDSRNVNRRRKISMWVAWSIFQVFTMEDEPPAKRVAQEIWGKSFLAGIDSEIQKARHITDGRVVQFLSDPFSAVNVVEFPRAKHRGISSTFTPTSQDGIVPGTREVAHLLRIMRQVGWEEGVMTPARNPSVPILTAFDRQSMLYLDPFIYTNPETGEIKASLICANGARTNESRGCAVYDVPGYDKTLPPLPAFMTLDERSTFLSTGIIPVSSTICLLCLSQVYVSRAVCNSHNSSPGGRRKYTIQEFQVIVGPDGFDQKYCIEMYEGGPLIVNVPVSMLCVCCDDRGKKFISEHKLWWKTEANGIPWTTQLF